MGFFFSGKTKRKQVRNSFICIYLLFIIYKECNRTRSRRRITSSVPRLGGILGMKSLKKIGLVKNFPILRTTMRRRGRL